MEVTEPVVPSERRPYILIVPIPCFLDDAGAVWLERSWHHDLVEHLSYLKNFTLCAPSRQKKDEPDLVEFKFPLNSIFSFVFLPAQTNYLRALLNLPRTALTLWSAIGRSTLVHSGIIGWPYPIGWLANPIALIRKKKLIIVVESDWRSEVPGSRSIMRRILDMGPVRGWMARWSCNRAHLALFTQPEYRDLLSSKNLDRSYITPAVWVNETNLLNPESASVLWERKLQKPVHLLFAGRLTVAKGTDTLLSAIRLLESRKVQIQIDVIGYGEDRNKFLESSAELRSVSLNVLDPVPYGDPFFKLLQRYHGILVPSLTNEQPRIVFDANSQALPVIASDTAGLRPYVDHGKTGWLIEKANAQDLANTIIRAHSNVLELRQMGLAALTTTRGMTHKAMHLGRSRLIQKHCINEP